MIYASIDMVLGLLHEYYLRGQQTSRAKSTVPKRRANGER